MNQHKDSGRPIAVVTGVAPGLGEVLCRHLAQSGYHVAGLARSDRMRRPLEEALGGDYTHLICDLGEAQQVETVLGNLAAEARVEVLIHNAHRLHIKPFEQTPVDVFEDVWRTACYGAMAAARTVLPAMAERGRGTVILTGATAGVRGGANFSAFASAKFALRGLSQALAREYGPKGVHVIHTILDGLIWEEQTRERFDPPEENCMNPDAIAKTYLALIDQHPSVWTHELDMRPSSEKF